ncbi:MAG: AraC family transcriptional regulator [Cyanobacteria bacterium P01_C01_bin.89]
MTLLLSIPEFYSKHPEVAERRQRMRQSWIIPINDVSGKNQGYRQKVNLRPGVSIQIDDYILQEKLLVEETSQKIHYSPRLNIEMSFMLSSHNHSEEVPAHHNFLEICRWEGLGGGIIPWQWQLGERIFKFDVHIEADVFRTLLDDQLDTLPESVARIVQSSQPNQINDDFRQVSATTPAMQSAIHQMLHCPYEGVARWIYWESKVLELLALRLNEVRQSNSQAPPKSSLKSDDLERVHHARKILHQRLADPPTLLELARLVGLNDYKLKVGFKQLFDTTVFEDLRRRRLDQARHLLQEREISVVAAAAAVGYTSKGHFAAAFRKQFGVNPSELHR